MRPARATTLTLRAFSALAVAALAGCAVMRIDVDVYKGPLANHEDVQLQQFAAMAIGSKPLLVQLRNNLEWSQQCSSKLNASVAVSATGRDPNAVIEACRKAAIDAKWEPDGHIQPDADGTPRLDDPQARQVNDVLSLYEDQGDAAISQFLGDAAERIAQIERSAGVLEVSADKETVDAHRWARIRSDMRSVSPVAGPCAVSSLWDVGDRASRASLARGLDGNELLEILKLRLQSLVDPQGVRLAGDGTRGALRWRGQCSLAQPCDPNEERATPDAARAPAAGLVSVIEALRLCPQRAAASAAGAQATDLNGYNEFYDRVLARGAPGGYGEWTLDALLELLYDDTGSDGARSLRAALEELAIAHFGARTAIESQWTDSVLAVQSLSRPERRSPENDRRLRSLARVIRVLTQPRDLAVAMRFAATPSGVTSRLRTLLGRFTYAAGMWDADLAYWAVPGAQAHRHAEAARALEQAVIFSPAFAASALEQLHRDFKRVPAAVFDKRGVPKSLSSLLERYADPVDRKFGITRGPLRGREANDLAVMSELEAASEELRSSSQSFGRGRPREGITTVIEAFLAAADPSNKDPQRLREARARLRDNLIQFAEKVRIVANNQRLLEGDERRNGRSLDRYVLVLQAVANSILVQADELKHRAAHELRSRARARDEGRALARSFAAAEGDSGGQTREVDALLAQAEQAETQIDVLDDLIALLRYEHVLAVRKHGASSDEAGRLDSALALAYEQRAGFGYIRPSSAYLRSVFAATDLQGDPRLRWTNQLEEHGGRSLPFIGEHVANAGDAERLAILDGIDKQFWQNINSVRVAGAGDTNYAIAKDDIGNWYVKAYSADPSPIVRSAQQLAMFSAGGALDVNLVRRLELERKDELTDSEQQELADLKREGPARGAPALTRVVNRYAQAYVTRTDADLLALRARLGTFGAGAEPRCDTPDVSPLVNQIRSSWSSLTRLPEGVAGTPETDFGGALRRAASVVLPAACAELASEDALPLPGSGQAFAAREARARADQQSLRILRALKQVKRFHAVLVEGLAERTNALLGGVSGTGAVPDGVAALDARVADLRAEQTRLIDKIEALKELIESSRAEVPNPDEVVAALERKAEEFDVQLTESKARELDVRRQRDALLAPAADRADDAARVREVSAAARSAATRIVRDLLTDFARRRQAAIEELERAVEFVGEASR